MSQFKVGKSLTLLKMAGVITVDQGWMRYGSYFVRGLTTVCAFYCLLGCILEGILHEMNYEKLSYLLFILLLPEVIFAKMWYVIKHRKKLNFIVDALERDIPLKNEHTEEETDFIKKRENTIYHYRNVYWLATTCGVFAVSSSPIVEKILVDYKIMIPKREKKFPFPMYVWFDDTTTFNYVAWYMFNVATSCLMNWVWIGADILFASLIAYFYTHLRIINNRIMNLGYRSGQDQVDSHLGKEVLKEKIRKIVDYHRDVLALCEKLEAIYNPQVLHLLLTTAIIVCMGGFQLSVGTTEDASHLWAVGTSVVNLSSSLYVYCWLGSVIEAEGERLTQAVYFTDWISFPPKERRKLILILARMQRKIQFTAGKFMKLTLGSFVAVMKTCYSFVAVLRQIYRP